MKRLSQKQILKTVPLEETIEFLKRLVAVNTSNPPGNEAPLLPIVKEAFQELGAKMEVIEKKKGRSNFIGKIGSGSPSLGFFTHLDTVPPGDGWNTNPFKAVVKNGKLYGRGSVDCKGNFVSSWAAIKTFLNLNKNFKGTLYFLGCADEETGSEYGVKYLLEKGFRVDYAIVPDGGYMDKIIIGEKGVIRFRIKSKGKQAHASTPQRGVNAIEKLIKLLHAIEGIRFEEFSYHESFDGITKNIGVIKGGHAVNIVPGYAEAEIDIRFPMGIKKEDIMKQIFQKEKELKRKEKDTQIIFEEIYNSEPHLTDENSSLVKAFLDSAKEMGLKMKVGTIGGNTDAKPLSLAGIETLVHDLDGSETAHQANEFVKIESIRKAAALYALTLMKIFK